MTYNAPVANIAPTPDFLVKELWRPEMAKVGRSKIVKSENRLITEVAIINPFVDIHRPGMCGFPIFSLGQQTKMKAIKRGRVSQKVGHDEHVHCPINTVLLVGRKDALDLYEERELRGEHDGRVDDL
jgi:hypothetical protein